MLRSDRRGRISDERRLLPSLHARVDDTPKGDLLRIGGDMNAKLVQAHIAESSYIGRAVKQSQRNDNGDRLALFSASNDLDFLHGALETGEQEIKSTSY